MELCLFKQQSCNSSSQAVRLPKEFRFEGSEVYIRKFGDEVIFSAKQLSWDNFFVLIVFLMMIF